MRISRSLPMLALLLPLIAFAADIPKDLEPLPEAPPPPAGMEAENPEPEVTITKKGADTIEEYRINGELIDELFYFPNSLSLIAFGDAGIVTTVNTKWAVYEGFTSLPSSEVRSDYGAAIAWHDGDARLGFAWRTDKKAPVSVFFRLNKAF